MFKFVCPTGVIKEVGCRKRDIDIASFTDRFAVIERFNYRKFTCTFL